MHVEQKYSNLLTQCAKSHLAIYECLPKKNTLVTCVYFMLLLFSLLIVVATLTHVFRNICIVNKTGETTPFTYMTTRFERNENASERSSKIYNVFTTWCPLYILIKEKHRTYMMHKNVYNTQP